MMKKLRHLFLIPTLAILILGFACTPSNAARRASGGPCTSVRVAVRIVGGRVYSKDQSYQSNGAVNANGAVRVALPELADPHRAPAGYRGIQALVDGGRLGGNAPALG